MDRPEVRRLIEMALSEDIGDGDATTAALVAPGERLAAAAVAREKMVMAGGPLLPLIFDCLGESATAEQLVPEGGLAVPGDTLIRIAGPARAVLSAERLILNFLQRLSGIATLTAQYVAAVAGTGVAILDTRKTTPGLRALVKYAVRCGGGTNHRIGLYDMAMIKDNHRAFWSRHGSGGLAGAVARIRQTQPNITVELEVDTEEEMREALLARPDWILLDNMPPEQLRRCVTLNAGQCKLEASGGITLASIRPVAETGVDAISVGALTHSAVAVDIGLDYLEDGIEQRT
jgi:nicotinate-nucleotide pyrophosphorylase (carboxylating)